jgi:CPA1 family monovalent cation:H+ antiporter
LSGLDQIVAERHIPEEVAQPLSSAHRARVKHIKNKSDGDDGHRKLTELHDEIASLLLERQKINELFRGKLKDEARRRIERELDMREASLTNRRAEE